MTTRRGMHHRIAAAMFGGPAMRLLLAALMLTGGVYGQANAEGAASSGATTLDRTVLPIQLPARPIIAELEGHIERTQPVIFSADDTADVGIDLGTPVVESVGAEATSKFTGKIPKVTIEIRDVNPKAEAAGTEGVEEVARRAD